MGDFMRKALLPLLASLLVCGTATAALIATNAHADQTGRQPVMMLAQNQPVPNTEREAGPPPPPDMDDTMMRGPRRDQFCQDIYASKAGEIAFLEAKLQLTPSQLPLFARWKDISMDMAKRHEGDCNGQETRLSAGQRQDLMERLNREEEMLKTRLADIDAERPALTALYAALTPTQKEEFARAARHRGAGRMHMMMGMMGHAPEMDRRLSRGPAGEPPLPQPPQ
jgi:hypothetical protein